MNANRDQLWAYVHGELSGAERREMDERIKADPEWAREADEIRRLDRQLGRLLPLAEQSDAAVEADILRQWESSAGDASAGMDRREILDVGRRETPLRFAWLFRGPRLALVAAAVLMVGIGLELQRKGPLDFVSETSQSAYRGDVPGPYTGAQLSHYADAIRRNLKQAYRRDPATGWFSRSSWLWDVRVLPQPDGKLQAVVSISDRATGALKQEWLQPYATGEALLADMGNLATRVVAQAQAVTKEQE